MEMFETTNELKYNLNKHLQLPHHEPLKITQKSPLLKQKYNDFLKYLATLAKNSDNNSKTHLKEIIKITSDAEEQYALVIFYWKCKGIITPKSHKYNKLQPHEIQKIKEMYVAGYSIYAIAKALNRHTSTIYYVLKRLGLK